MPQKPLDASDETVRLTIRLTKRQTHVIDQLRGSRTRSAYLRTLIDDVIYTGPEELPQATVPVPDPRKSGGMKIVPAQEHRWHRFRKTGIVNYVKGVPQYRQVCSEPGCDEIKVGP